MQRVCDIGTLSKAESHLETSMQRDCDMGTLGKAESEKPLFKEKAGLDHVRFRYERKGVSAVKYFCLRSKHFVI